MSYRNMLLIQYIDIFFIIKQDQSLLKEKDYFSNLSQTLACVGRNNNWGANFIKIVPKTLNFNHI